MKFKSISSHPEPLADGRVVAPYEEFEMSREQAEDPSNLHLFNDDKVLAYSQAGDKLIQDRKVAEEDLTEHFRKAHEAQLAEEAEAWKTDPDNPNREEVVTS